MLDRKDCKMCGEIKELDFFPRDKKTKTGRHSYCRECCKIKSKTWESNNSREDYRKEYYNKMKKEISRKRKENRIKNPQHYKEQQKRNLFKNKEAIIKSNENWRIKNREHLKNYSKLYRQKNPAWANMTGSLTRAKRLKATPPWLSKEQKKQILEIYKKAKDLSIETGVNYSVDHIIPLKNPLVCGLHVPWNLRIITTEENLKKKNKLFQEIDNET